MQGVVISSYNASVWALGQKDYCESETSLGGTVNSKAP